MYFETYFNERHDIIGNALLNIEAVDKINDLERFNDAIADLNQLFGKTLNINEFDEIMMSDESLSF